MSNEKNINLRHLLAGLSDLKEHITDLYNSLKMNLGPEATYIHEWHDLKRLQLDGEASDEIEGDALITDILQHCWAKDVDYVWHYRGSKFRITPFKSGTTTDGGFIIYYGQKHSLVTFAGVVRDAVDTATPIWEAIVAQMFGIADGYASASLHNPEVLEQAVKDGRLTKVLADQPAPDAEVAEDLKWKDGYGVDPAEAIKVPDGADGTLACADPVPEPDCPEEVPAPAEPVVDQAEEPVSKPKKNWKEKRAKEKYLIRAGGGPEDDKDKDGYLKWKQSVESPQRFG